MRTDWEAWRAGVRLQKLDANEDIAQQWEQTIVASLRRRMARAYRSLTGLHPAQRHDCREALQNLRQAGTMTVAELLDDFHNKESSLEG